MANRNPMILLSIPAFMAGCFDSKSEEPACFASAWSGDPGYTFKAENFGCETAPIAGNFLLDVTSINLPSGITSTANIKSNFNASRAAWNGNSSNFTIRYAGATIAGGVNVWDDAHHVFMNPSYDLDVPGTFASTIIHADPSNPNIGVDCDIQLYAQQENASGVIVPNPWTEVNPPNAPTDMALQAVLTHELGHCVGFSENSIPGSVMNYNSFNFGLPAPSLNAEDVSAVQRIYGL